MKNYEFVVWLEGYMDVCEHDPLTVKKLHIIKNHLNLVKSIEGELGEFNTMIYSIVSDALKHSLGEKQLSMLKETLSDKLRQFLEDAFPQERID